MQKLHPLLPPPFRHNIQKNVVKPCGKCDKSRAKSIYHIFRTVSQRFFREVQNIMSERCGGGRGAASAGMLCYFTKCLGAYLTMVTSSTAHIFWLWCTHMDSKVVKYQFICSHHHKVSSDLREKIIHIRRNPVEKKSENLIKNITHKIFRQSNAHI